MNRVKFIRNHMQLSRNAMHNLYNIPASSIERWERGQIPSITSCRLLISAAKNHGLEVDIDWLRQLHDNPPRALNEKYPTKINQLLNGLKQVKHSYSAYLVDNDAMQPMYKTGDWLIGERINLAELPCFDGKICLVITQTGHYLRIVKTTDSPGFYDLLVSNTLANAKCFYSEQILAAHAIVFHLIA